MKPGSPNGGKPQQQRNDRPRGRHNMGGGGMGGGKKPMNVRNQTFDSNGPDIRVRGNAHQVMEKYLAMARDATSQGDRVAAENYYQHAEHYFRVINAANAANPQRPRPMSTPAEDQGPGPDCDDEESSSSSSSSSSASTSHATSESAAGPDNDDGQAQAVNA